MPASATMRLTATTQFGLEDVLADELRQLGATIEHVGSRAVECNGFLAGGTAEANRRIAPVFYRSRYCRYLSWAV